MRFATLLVTLALLPFLMVVGATPVRAQTLVVDGPPGAVLPTVTPRYTLRALGLPLNARPLVFTLLISRNPNVEGSFEQTITVTSSDTIVNILVRRLLPNGTLGNPVSVYWKASVALPNGAVIESRITGPKEVPLWLALVTPNSNKGDGAFTTRRPRFVWRSAKIDPEFGFWTYDLQIKNPAGTEQSISGLRDTIFVPAQELQANTLYTWQVRATAEPTKEAVTVASLSTFSIADPSVPTTTLLYQNFPNPFPSPISFSTCFWFDVKVGGARISLDIVDMRGSLVKRIVPLSDFAAGTYGRGPEGSGNNCDNRYVWNGTATDGRSVQGGIYLARFIATGSPPLFKKVVFTGR